MIQKSNPPARPETTGGIHAAGEIIAHHHDRIDHVYFDGERTGAALFDLLKLCRKHRLPYSRVPVAKLDHLAGNDRHQGVVVLSPARPFADLNEVLRAAEGGGVAPLLLVPASVEDPHNLGAMIRSAVAFGVNAVVLERRYTASTGQGTSRSSAGMVEHIPLCRPRNLEGCIGDLMKSGYQVVGAAGEGKVRPDQVDWTGPTVLVMGGEHDGIPPYLKKLCTMVVGIPMDRQAESLNVSVAAGILLYECARGRGFPFVR